MVVKREGLKIITVQADMTKPFFEDETFDIFNPVLNVYIEDLENMYIKKSHIESK